MIIIIFFEDETPLPAWKFGKIDTISKTRPPLRPRFRYCIDFPEFSCQQKESFGRKQKQMWGGKYFKKIEFWNSTNIHEILAGFLLNLLLYIYNHHRISRLHFFRIDLVPFSSFSEVANFLANLNFQRLISRETCHFLCKILDKQYRIEVIISSLLIWSSVWSLSENIFCDGDGPPPNIQRMRMDLKCVVALILKYNLFPYVLLLTRISLWTLLKIDLLLSITPHLQVCPFQFKIGIVLADDTYYHCFLLKNALQIETVYVLRYK